jgi:ABC-type transport system involved in cytochrome bd biosynthesis fused ATPase/permease subunit
MRERTVLSVTHKLEQLSEAAKIYMIDDGKVIEVGNYSELMERKDSFYRLLHGRGV